MIWGYHYFRKHPYKPLRNWVDTIIPYAAYALLYENHGSLDPGTDGSYAAFVDGFWVGFGRSFPHEEILKNCRCGCLFSSCPCHTNKNPMA